MTRIAAGAGRGAAESAGRMGCIQCGARTGIGETACGECHHPIAFPRAISTFVVTDDDFRTAIRDVSANGALRFTERQLWYALGRPMRDWRRLPARDYPFLLYAFCGAFPGFVAKVFFPVPAADVAAGAGAIAALVLRAYLMHQDVRPPLEEPALPHLSLEALRASYLPRWTAAHGPVPGLLPRGGGALPAGSALLPADGSAPPDRAVVTDTRETAGMLVANRFHTEHGCAVLSLDGAPAGEAEAVKEALRRTPGLTVFALHDATPEGCSLPLTLRQPAWFPDPAVRIVDLGLRPEIAWRARVPALPGPPVLPPPLPAWLLSREERTWLAHGNAGELAALPPAYLLRAVNEGMVAAGPYAAGGGSGGGIVVVDGFG